MRAVKWSTSHFEEQNGSQNFVISGHLEIEIVSGIPAPAAHFDHEISFLSLTQKAFCTPQAKLQLGSLIAMSFFGCLFLDLSILLRYSC